MINIPRERKPVRVLIVDDHPVVLTGVRGALSQEKGIDTVGVASSGRQALRLAKQLEPDVVLMDIGLPSMNGLEVTKRLREVSPKIKVIAFTMHENKEYVLEIIRLGARGYVLKNTSIDELRRAIHAVYKGNRYFSPAISKLLVDQYVAHVEGKGEGRELTPREGEVLALIATGMSSKEIAVKLKLSTRTVDTHRERIMNKLGIHSAVGLARYAIEKGIARVPKN